jgi:hypothetical protein
VVVHTAEPTNSTSISTHVSIIRAHITNCVGATATNNTVIVYANMTALSGNSNDVCAQSAQFVYWTDTNRNSRIASCVCNNTTTNNNNNSRTNDTVFMCVCPILQTIGVSTMYIQLQLMCAHTQAHSQTYTLTVPFCLPTLTSVRLSAHTSIGASTAGGDVMIVRGKHLHTNSAFAFASASNTHDYADIDVDDCAQTLNLTNTHTRAHTSTVMLQYWPSVHTNTHTNMSINMSAPCCSVVFDRVLMCVLGPGVGANLTFQLVYTHTNTQTDTQTDTQTVLVSNVLPSSVSYAHPVLTHISHTHTDTATDTDTNPYPYGFNDSNGNESTVLTLHGYNFGSSPHTLESVTLTLQYELMAQQSHKHTHSDNNDDDDNNDEDECVYVSAYSQMESAGVTTLCANTQSNTHTNTLTNTHTDTVIFDITPMCVLTVPHTTITCVFADTVSNEQFQFSAVGATLVASVRVCGQTSGQPTVHTPPPVISEVSVFALSAHTDTHTNTYVNVFSSLLSVCDHTDLVDCLFDTQIATVQTRMRFGGGNLVLITGHHFGPQTLTNTHTSHTHTALNFIDFVTYGPTGTEYTAHDCVVIRTNTHILCVSAAGVGVNHTWSVSVASQLSAHTHTHRHVGTTSYEPFLLRTNTPLMCEASGGCVMNVHTNYYVTVDSMCAHTAMMSVSVLFGEMVLVNPIASWDSNCSLVLNITIPSAATNAQSDANSPFVYVHAIMFVSYDKDNDQTDDDDAEEEIQTIESGNELLFAYSLPIIVQTDVIPYTTIVRTNTTNSSASMSAHTQYTLRITGHSFTDTPLVQLLQASNNSSINLSSKRPIILTNCVLTHTTDNDIVECNNVPLNNGFVSISTFTDYFLTDTTTSTRIHNSSSCDEYCAMASFGEGYVGANTHVPVVLGHRMIVGSARTEGNTAAQPAVLQVVGQHLLSRSAADTHRDENRTTTTSMLVELSVGSIVQITSHVCPIIGVQSVSIQQLIQTDALAFLINTSNYCSTHTSVTDGDSDFADIFSCLHLDSSVNVDVIECLLPSGHGTNNSVVVSTFPPVWNMSTTIVDREEVDAGALLGEIVAQSTTLQSHATRDCSSNPSSVDCFVYDNPVVYEILPPNGSRIGGYSVIVRGDNFAVDTYSFEDDDYYAKNVHVIVGGVEWPIDFAQSNQTTLTISSVPPGTGTNLLVEVVAFGRNSSSPSLLSSKHAVFSYFQPMITTNVSDWPVLTTGKIDCTSTNRALIEGSEFGFVQPVVVMDRQYVLAVVSFTQEQIVVELPPGVGRQHTLAVFFDGQFSSATANNGAAVPGYINYEPPIVTKISYSGICSPAQSYEDNDYGTGNSDYCTVTLIGVNLGIPADNVSAFSSAVQVVVGSFGHGRVLFSNFSHLVFLPPNGFGLSNEVIVIVGGQTIVQSTDSKGSGCLAASGLFPVLFSYALPRLAGARIVPLSRFQQSAVNASSPALETVVDVLNGGVDASILMVEGFNFGFPSLVDVVIHVQSGDGGHSRELDWTICVLIEQTNARLSCLLPLTACGGNVPVTVTFNTDKFVLRTNISFPQPVLHKVVIVGKRARSPQVFAQMGSTSNVEWYNLDASQDFESPENQNIIRIYGENFGHLPTDTIVQFTDAAVDQFDANATSHMWYCFNISWGSSALMSAASVLASGQSTMPSGVDYIECAVPPSGSSTTLVHPAWPRMLTGNKSISVYIAGQWSNNTLPYTVNHCVRGFYGLPEGDVCAFCGIDGLVSGLYCPLDNMANPLAARGWYIKQLPNVRTSKTTKNATTDTLISMLLDGFTRPQSESETVNELACSAARTTCPVALSCDFNTQSDMPSSISVTESLALHAESHCQGYDNQCLYGYKGECCSYCIDGFTNVNGDCRPCAETFGSLVLYVCAVVFGVICVFVATRTVSKTWIRNMNKPNDRRRTKDESPSQLVAQAWYHLSLSYLCLSVFCQLLSVFISTTSFTSLPNSIQTLLTLLSVLFGLQMDNNAFSCLLCSRLTNDPHVCMQWQFWLVNALSGCLMLRMGGLCYRTYKSVNLSVLKSKLPGNVRPVMPSYRLVHVCLFWLIVVCPLTVQTDISVFNCFEVYPSDGHSYLLTIGVNEQGRCGNTANQWLQLVAGVSLCLILGVCSCVFIGMFTGLHVTGHMEGTNDDTKPAAKVTENTTDIPQQKTMMRTRPSTHDAPNPDDSDIDEDRLYDVRLTTEEECKINFDAAQDIIKNNSNETIAPSQYADEITDPKADSVIHHSYVVGDLVWLSVLVMGRIVLAFVVINLRYQQTTVFAVGTLLALMWFVSVWTVRRRREIDSHLVQVFYWRKPDDQGAVVWTYCRELFGSHDLSIVQFVAAGLFCLALILLLLVSTAKSNAQASTTQSTVLTLLFHIVFAISVLLLLLRIWWFGVFVYKQPRKLLDKVSEHQNIVAPTETTVINPIMYWNHKFNRNKATVDNSTHESTISITEMEERVSTWTSFDEYEDRSEQTTRFSTQRYAHMATKNPLFVDRAPPPKVQRHTKNKDNESDTVAAVDKHIDGAHVEYSTEMTTNISSTAPTSVVQDLINELNGATGEDSDYQEEVCHEDTEYNTFVTSTITTTTTTVITAQETSNTTNATFVTETTIHEHGIPETNPTKGDDSEGLNDAARCDSDLVPISANSTAVIPANDVTDCSMKRLPSPPPPPPYSHLAARARRSNAGHDDNVNRPRTKDSTLPGASIATGSMTQATVAPRPIPPPPPPFPPQVIAASTETMPMKSSSPPLLLSSSTQRPARHELMVASADGRNGDRGNALGSNDSPNDADETANDASRKDSNWKQLKTVETRRNSLKDREKRGNTLIYDPDQVLIKNVPYVPRKVRPPPKK